MACATAFGGRCWLIRIASTSRRVSGPSSARWTRTWPRVGSSVTSLQRVSLLDRTNTIPTTAQRWGFTPPPKRRCNSVGMGTSRAHPQTSLDARTSRSHSIFIRPSHTFRKQEHHHSIFRRPAAAAAAPPPVQQHPRALSVSSSPSSTSPSPPPSSSIGVGARGGNESFAPPPPDPEWYSRLLIKLPHGMDPYLKLIRFDKPIGTWLLLWPGLWGLAAASDPSLPSLLLVSTFAVGSLAMRGAGCTINDLWDRRIDALVERTRTRPIASGAISPAKGVVFLGAQLSVALGILLSLNPACINLGVASMGLVVAYPLMKRITYWPQAFLGLAMNYGVLMGYAAVTGTIDPLVVVPLYASGIAWTLLYDTIYAHQDKSDDVVIGVKSTALLFGDETKKYLGYMAAASVTGFGLTGVALDMGVPFYVGVSGVAAHFMWQIRTLDIDSGSDCLKKFISNKWIGVIVFLSFLAGTTEKRWRQTGEPEPEERS